MSYTLRSGLTAGSVDHPEHGEFEIADGSVEVDGYETASDLVDEFGSLAWADADPGQPDGGAGADDGDDDAEPESDDGFDIDAWLDHDYEDRAREVEAGGVDAHLDAIKANERSATVIDAVDERIDELEG